MSAGFMIGSQKKEKPFYTNGSTYFIREGLKRLPWDAEYQLRGAECLVFPKSMTLLEGLFQSTKLKKVIVLSEEVTIEDSSFYNCPNLEEVVIRGKVFLKENAFSRCRKLRIARIEGEILQWEKGAFACCPSLKTNKLGKMDYIGTPEEPYKILYSTDEDVTYFSPKEQTQYIAAGAFANRNGLQSVRLGSVRLVGAFAFANCEGLSVLHLDKTERIGKNAFKGCNRLTSVEIGSSVKIIEDGAFSECMQLESVDFRAVRNVDIGISFTSCPVLRNVRFADVPKSVKSRSFESCGSLQYNRYEKCLYMGDEKNPYRILLRKEGERRIPSLVIHEGTEYIAEQAFMADKWLQNVVVPGSVKRIGREAFARANMERLELKEGVKCIEGNAFQHCGRLKEAWFPKGLQYVGNGAFEESARSGIGYFAGPVHGVEPRAFAMCGMCPAWMLDNCPTGDHVRYAYSWVSGHRTPFDGKRIEEYIVRERRLILKKIVDRDDVTALRTLIGIIGKKEFSLPILEDAIKKADGKPELTEALLQYKEKTYPQERLEKMERLEEERVFGDRPLPKAVWIKSFFLKTVNGKYVIEGSRDPFAERLFIPGKIGRSKVAVGQNAFFGNKKLVSVECGEGLTEIGRSAFAFCPELEEIVLPASIEEIGEDVLQGCDKVTVIAPEGSVAEEYAKKNGLKTGDNE